MQKLFFTVFMVAAVFLSYTPAFTADRTWNGGAGGNDWSLDWNWQNQLEPVAGDALFFGGTTRLSNNNDLDANTSFAGITFNNDAGAFTLGGNRITLTGDITNNDDSNQTVNIDMILSGTRTITGDSGATTLGGVLSGSGGLTKNGSNTLYLNNTNTYTGATAVDSGELRLLEPGAIADTSAVTVASGATLSMNATNQSIGSLAGAGNVTLALFGTPTLTIGGDNTSTTFSGVIANDTGTLAITKGGSGTLTLSGANTYSGLTTISAGTLAVANASALGTGAVTNNATLDIGTTQLSGIGVYTQNAGSTLSLTANSASTYGQITSAVAAAVNAGSTVSMTVGGYIPNNATLTIIDTGGAGIGSVPNTINTSGSSFITFSAANSGNNLVLTANRSDGFASAAANSNAQNVGEVLDNISNPTGDMNTVLSTLDSASSSTVASSENTMYPTADRGTINTTNQSLDKFVAQTVIRLQDSKIEEGDKNKNNSNEDNLLRNDIWMQTYGDYAHQDARGLSNGYLARVWGTIIGIDRSFMEGSLRLGIAQGFSGGQVLSKDNSGHTGIMSYQTGLYGEYEGRVHPYILDAVLTYGYNDYDSSRSVDVAGSNRTASSDYTGQQFSTYLEGGYKFKNKNFDITPLLALNYAYLHLSGYTESGADSMNLNVDAQNYDTLQLGTGLRISRAIDTKNMLFTPELHFRYFYAVINDKQQTTAYFTGGGTSFQTTGYRPQASSFNLGARLEFFNKKNITLLADVDTIFKDGYYEAGGSIAVKYSF